jgi:hypothetical protein
MKQADTDLWWQSKLAHSYGLQRKHTAALALIQTDDFPLVDLGAGNGIFLKALEDRYPEKPVYGVELSEVAVSQKLCKTKIEQGSILEWYPRQKSIKTVTLIDVIEHLLNPEQLLSQVTGYASQVLIACPNFNFYQARIDVMLGKIPFQNKPSRGGHVYWCQYNSLLKLFSDCKLKIAQENHIYPKNNYHLARIIGNLRPSLFACEFVFLLTVVK